MPLDSFQADRLNSATIEVLGPTPLLSNILGAQASLLDTLHTQLHLEKVSEFDVGSQDGSATISLDVYRGSQVEVTAVWGAFTSPATILYGSLECWATADLDAPHLLVELSFNGDTLLVYCHMLPRSDLVQDLKHFEQYTACPPGCSRSWAELDTACGQREGWLSFRSARPLVRYLGAGLAISYRMDPNLAAGAAEVAAEALTLWLAILGSAGSVPDERQAAMQQRDVAMRKAVVWGDSKFKALEKVFGAEAVAHMGLLLTGSEGGLES